MLAHVSGLPREPVGDIWETLEQPDAQGLVKGFSEAERVLKPHHRWHYSNLAYGMRGHGTGMFTARGAARVRGVAVACPWYPAEGRPW